jgi:hypothetical protein
LKDILLITPPFTQLNTPYPATAYLKGFLNTKNIASYQIDLGIEVINELFSSKQLSKLFDSVETRSDILENNIIRIIGMKSDYISTIDTVLEFLKGKQPNLARLICSGNFLPIGSRLAAAEDLVYAFGEMGVQDQAKHLATLYLEDLSDFIVTCIDQNFGFSRYAERLGRSANSFDELHENLQLPCSIIENITLSILSKRIQKVQPKLVCFSVPFPGNLFSAFRCAQFLKSQYPEVKIAMGGGFPNTELRSLSDVRVFDYFDFITLDDGELPIELLYNHVVSPTKEKIEFKRTYYKENDEVVYNNNSSQIDYKQHQIGTPDYSDLFLDEYISVIEIANPMHSLWSDGRWNKLTMAHGCYWGKCSFCDVSLDYIKLYEPITAKLLVDRMEQLIESTGERGFHFVDEAAPPALMREVALELLKRKLVVTWWANIRFEKSFTSSLCYLLSKSGCIAVSGGLEVASDRLLKLIEKGVTVEQVAQVTQNLTNAGIMVHAYLMYGYPTQTIQETVNSLEMVRQLFEAGVLKSGFWHQFALTAHSPIGLNPKNYGINPLLNEITFANNDVDFIDQTGIDHSKFSNGLKKSLYNYMHDVGFEVPLNEWFDFKIPPTTVSKNYIKNCLTGLTKWEVKPSAKVYWLGNLPTSKLTYRRKKGKNRQVLSLTFHETTLTFSVDFEPALGKWVHLLLVRLHSANQFNCTYQSLKEEYLQHFENFELFWYSKPLELLKNNGLIHI